MRYITHIRLSGGKKHEHITHFAWKEGATSGTSTRAELVEWVNGGREARCGPPPSNVKVVVVDATPPYLRTIANDTYTDNLLALPQF